jgi:hypothetical protein
MCSDVGTKIRLVLNGIFAALGPFKPSLSSLDGAEHISAMLDTAGELKQGPRGHRHGARRAMIAVLMYRRDAGRQRHRRARDGHVERERAPPENDRGPP